MNVLHLKGHFLMSRRARENSKKFLLGPIFVRPAIGQLIPEAGTVRTVLAIFGPL